MPLTWRNVEAPDFGRALEGVRGATNAFTDAIGGLDRGLGRYDATLDEAASNRLLAEFAGMADPTAARQRLVALTSDPNFARYNAATIGAVTARPGQLINEALAGTNLDAAKFGLDNAKADRTTDMRLGAGMQDYITKGTPLDFTGAGASKVAGLINNAQNYRAGELGMDQTRLGMDSTRLNMDVTRQGMTQNAWNFERQKESYNDGKAADALLMGVDINSFDQVSAENWLRSQKGISPGVYNAVRSRIPSLGFGVAGGAPGLGVGGGAGNVERLITGGGYLPDSVQTQGQTVEYGKQLNRNGQASSATGVFQITQSTREEFGEKALGKDWRSQPINMQTDDAIAQQIFKSTGGDPSKLKGRWVALQKYSDAQVAQMAKGGWAGIRGAIAQGESGADLAQLQKNRAATLLGMATQAGQRNANSVAPDYMAAMQDTRPVGQVIGSMKKNSIYSGKSDGDLLEMVQGVQAQAAEAGKPITPAMAAAILERNPTYNNPSQLRRILNNVASVGGLIDPFNWYSNKPSIEADDKAVSRAIRDYTGGKIDRAVMANVDAGIVGQQMNAAQAQLDAAQARLAAATASRARGRNVDVGAAQAEVNRLARIVNLGNAGVQMDPTLTSYGSPTSRPRAGTAPPARMTPAAQAMWMAALNAQRK